MSLQQLAAQRMAAQGRGPDSQLVHMSPREVEGLQALAMAAGGSLSINPQTGLPEAGFLDKMLPLLIGAGLTAASGGALTPLMAAGITGAGYGAATGSLQKGLMAGLGAYGGAGLGAGLMGAGAETLGATANAMGVPAATGAGSQAAMLAAQNQGFGQAGLEALGQSAATAPGAFTDFVKTPVQSMTSGAMGLTEAPGRTAFMNAIGGGKEALKFGAAAAAPMLLDQPKFTPPAPDTEQYKYEFDPGRVEDPEAGYTGPVSGQRNFFNPSFKRQYAEGGPVEQMSENNIFDMQNARGGVSDMGIDSYTGMERMAEGGTTDENRYSGNAYAFAPVAQAAPSPGRRRVAAAPAPVEDPVARGPMPVEDPVARARLDDLERQELIAQGYRGDDAMPTANKFTPAEQPYVPPYVPPVAAGEYTYEYNPETQTYINVAPPPPDPAAVAAPEAVSDPYAGVSYGFARGGITDLGGYSDGGRLLRGPGDGVSDSIPAMIGEKQPARLADGEFVVPARIVSELGNGSTEAGARKLYAMMDRVQKARRKTVGNGKVANNPRADKYLPA